MNKQKRLRHNKKRKCLKNKLNNDTSLSRGISSVAHISRDKRLDTKRKLGWSWSMRDDSHTESA